MPPSEPPDGFFVTWGVVEWALAALTGIVTALSAFIWRIGVKLGAFEKEFSLLQADINDRREKLERQLASLEGNDRNLERAVAALPDAIMTRITGSFEGSFRYLNGRIDELLARMRPIP
jgi:hypothetical protein